MISRFSLEGGPRQCDVCCLPPAPRLGVGTLADSYAGDGRTYRFGDCELTPGLRELRRQGRLSSVEPKVFDLLLYLIENRERVIGKEELNRQIWQGRFVTDASLGTCVKLARQAIGDSGKAQNFIRTVPRRGYRFVGDVTHCDPTTSDQINGGKSGVFRAWAIPAGSALAILVSISGIGLWWEEPSKPEIEPATVERVALRLPDQLSVAVLPFKYMSDTPDLESVAEGLTEDLITDLSKISGLLVAGRGLVPTGTGPTAAPMRVAEKLGVRLVLDGSVRRAAGTLRINARILDATSGRYVWADRYDGTLGEDFALQDRVTREIVAVVSAQLTVGKREHFAARGTYSLEAYAVFQKGWDHYTKRTPNGFRLAVPFFKQAVALDPTYGQAYAALASIYWEGASQRLWYEALGLLWGEARTQAEEYLVNALRYPSPLAHRVASLTYLGDGFCGRALDAETRRQDFELALLEARKAVSLDPNDPEGHIAIAHVLTMSGRPEEAVVYIDTAMHLVGEVPSDYFFESAFARFGMDEFDETARLLDRVLEQNPQNIQASYLRVPTYALLGSDRKMDLALKHLQEISPVEVYLIYYERFWGLYKDRIDDNRIRRGLQLAGLPH